MYAWTILGALTVGIAAYLLLSGFLKTWRLYRGVRVITCPENLQPAAVGVAAFDAAKWYAISGETDLHLRKCSRWPEMEGCDEACLTQIRSNPIACQLQTIVASWYEGRNCRYCERPIGKVVWHDRPPAVRLNDGTTREWKEIAPQDLPKVFNTGEAVCWACHTVEEFRHEHPDLVIERPHPGSQQHTIPPSMSVY